MSDAQRQANSKVVQMALRPVLSTNAESGTSAKAPPLNAPFSSLAGGPYLWTEAVMHAAAKDPELKRFYRHKLIQKGMGKARIAAGTQTGYPAVDHDARPD
jgi:hypothetical protein